MPTSIESYLSDLKQALAGRDSALVQDAVSDAHEHLFTALETRRPQPDFDESTALDTIIEEYGSPAEIAMAYAEIERRLPAGLPAPSVPQHSWLARFFGVYADSRAWGALFYMFLALPLGILYFIWVVTGLSISLTLAMFIFGLIFALLFLLSVRALALLEGRLVESLLGARMPRRSFFFPQGDTWSSRLKQLVLRRDVWLSIVYFFLQMPLGLLYFCLMIILLTLGISLTIAPLIALVTHIPPTIQVDNVSYNAPWLTPFLMLAGILLTTSCLHLARGLGQLHGRYARTLLLQE